ncbi:PEP-CTERM sorting domain-containing protein [Aeoliella sp. ICT_H6.2]|uniref:PEP-CTERM sorting domain-containing protein n=1 Tax=Aeoliella straminimaris TaxID=2954799 RepID=A0A9X2FA14_9BACT|nr:PEP-CTERM sorting domain-containing protein [Aeoliella straminimaris]MCO6044679.1 PEP-CTERM sorting domain-containing protein [Aeoliella straminimaris]
MSRFLPITAILFAFAAPALADLRVDINDRSSDTEPQTQPSFTGVTQDGLTGIVTDIGTIDISMTGVPGTSNLDDRNRGTTSVDTTLPLSRLLRDLVFNAQNLPDRGTIDVTIANLNAGDYLFTVYSHDPSVDHVSQDLQLSTDAGATFPIEVQNALVSTGSAPVPFGHTSIPFTASGADVVLRLVGDEGTPGFSNELAILNGFVIEPFTEYGDFNRAGGVTVDDFFILSANLGTHLDGNFAGHAGGDIDLDGDVDLDDFGTFKDMYPAIVAAATGVPEPSSVVLVATAAVGVLALRRRVRQP